MESTPTGKLVAIEFPIREGMAHSTPGPPSFGAFPKRALWLMLSFAEESMKARARVPVAAAETGLESSGVVQCAQKQPQPL
jgi:hypothetical protein